MMQQDPSLMSSLNQKEHKMADYTDTLSYSVTLEGIAYADTIEETISTALEVKRTY